MLKSITLQNFKSFGEKQTVPLQPITVLVGPNNSGKSNFLSLGRFVFNSVEGGFKEALDAEGGADFLFHRPVSGNGRLVIEYEHKFGRYTSVLRRDSAAPFVLQEDERFTVDPSRDLWTRSDQTDRLVVVGGVIPVDASEPFAGLRAIPDLERLPKRVPPKARDIFVSVASSAAIKLALETLRQDSEVVPDPQLGPDGSGMAAVLALWRGAEPDKSEQLDKFLSECMPAIKHALVKPAPTPSFQRLWIQQADRESFDARHVSDGVIFFIGLAMQIIAVEEGSTVFIEEPEQSIHPRKLSDIVNLLRRAVEERGCQFVIATHSPVLLNEFRDEPEAIVLFRRGENGTRVKPLSEIPELIEALAKSDPGAMLADGFFNQPS